MRGGSGCGRVAGGAARKSGLQLPGSSATMLRPQSRSASWKAVASLTAISSSSASALASAAASAPAVLAAGQRRSFARAGYTKSGSSTGYGGGAPPRPDGDKFYKLLGVEKAADEAAIKAAYKKQAMQHHPDRGGDEATFKEISHAYEVLSNPEKRQLYDMYGEAGLNGQANGAGEEGYTDPMDLFWQTFHFHMGGNARGKPRTPDSKYTLQLSLEEIYSGTSRSITFNRDKLCGSCEGFGGHKRTSCAQCQGTGFVTMMIQQGPFVQSVSNPCPGCGSKGYVIPPGNICGSCSGKGLAKEKKVFDVNIEPGVQEGAQFRYRGQADEAPGHDTGDVVIVIKQIQHKTFSRMRDALIMEKSISLAEALAGFEFPVRLLNGEDLTLRSAEGEVIEPGTVMVVEGRGLPRKPGERPGNLFVKLDVQFPKRLTRDTQKSLTEVLQGPPLSDEPPKGSEAPRKLSKEQQRELSKLFMQEEQQRAQQAQGQGHSCVQQ